jgi:flagellar motor switch protein FliG
MSTELATTSPPANGVAHTSTRPIGVKLRGREKAAVLVIALGSEQAAEVLKHLGEREVEAVSSEVASLRQVHQDTKLAVLHEVADRLALATVDHGGPNYARKVLEHMVGPIRAEEIIASLHVTGDMRPFEFLRRTPPEQIVAFLAEETTQTVALVVASLNPSLAARVLALLPAEMQVDVALRIATMAETNPDVIRDVERGLRMKMSSVLTQEFSSAGGIDSLAEILNRAGRSTERNVVEAIGQRNNELADGIRQRLFTFDDLIVLTDRDIQLLLREVDQKDLALALRGVTPELTERIMANMSQRGAQMLVEDMEAAPPQRRQVVDEAQSKVVGIVRRLEEAGAITIRRGAEAEEDDVI